MLSREHYKETQKKLSLIFNKLNFYSIPAKTYLPTMWVATFV